MLHAVAETLGRTEHVPLAIVCVVARSLLRHQTPHMHETLPHRNTEHMYEATAHPVYAVSHVNANEGSLQIFLDEIFCFVVNKTRPNQVLLQLNVLLSHWKRGRSAGECHNLMLGGRKSVKQCHFVLRVISDVV